MKMQIAAAGTVDPRIIVEDKGTSLAVHYRMAPERGPLIRNKIAAILDRTPEEKLEMLCCKAVIEIKPPNFNKGVAVCELMKSAPFDAHHLRELKALVEIEKEEWARKMQRRPCTCRSPRTRPSSSMVLGPSMLNRIGHEPRWGKQN